MDMYITVYFGTVVMAMVLVPVVSQLAKKFCLLDVPDPRKVHQTPIPRIGGIAFVLPTLILVIFAFFINKEMNESLDKTRMEFFVLIFASLFVFVMGLFDDLRSLPAYVKLFSILAASLAVCLSGAKLDSISIGSWLELEMGWAAWPLTLLWITIITVGMNFIDGLDGLAAGVAFIVCGMIALMAFLSGQIAMVVLMLALLGGVTGFLFFNFYPAKIFMGDGGSMFLGFMIGAGSVVCQTKTSTFVGMALPFLAMGVPILDTVIAVVRRRVLDRRSVFAPDRYHLHHRLVDLGLHQRTVVIVLYALTGIGAALGVLSLTLGGEWSIGMFGMGLLLLFAVFGCLHGKRFYELAMILKHNREVAQETKRAKQDFEHAETRMRDVASFDAWWEILCDMARHMHFKSLGVWNCCNDHFVKTCGWSAPGEPFAADQTMKLTFPLQINGKTKWEIRARVWINGLLELSGHQAMLLGRLIDEFPPPERKEELALFVQRKGMTAQACSTEQEAFSMAMSNTQTLLETARVPAPLDIMGVPVVPFESYHQALDCIEETIDSGTQSFWIAINPIKIYHAWRDAELHRLLRRADVGICDGIGISLTAKILHKRGLKRCTGCDLFFKLLSRACRKGWGVYLLGASPESNAAARLELQKAYPDLQIVGWQDGYFKDSLAVVEHINRSGAQLLFVAMGSPKQEEWIWCHRQAIKANFCMGVGGSFDIASGQLTRAPKIFRVTGTEFLYRLVREPRKRWRIQKVLFPYFLRVVEKKLTNIFISDQGRVDQARQ